MGYKRFTNQKNAALPPTKSATVRPPGRAHFESSTRKRAIRSEAAYRGAAQAASAPARLRMAALPRDWIVSEDAVIDAILYIGPAALHRRRNL